MHSKSTLLSSVLALLSAVKADFYIGNDKCSFWTGGGYDLVDYATVVRNGDFSCDGTNHIGVCCSFPEILLIAILTSIWSKFSMLK